MEFDPLPEEDEALAKRIIGAAIEVHRELGPGFIEFIYEQAMIHELSLAGITCEKQKSILVPYKGILLAGQRLDLIVGGRIILELKSVEQVMPIHEAQLLGDRPPPRPAHQLQRPHNQRQYQACHHLNRPLPLS